MKMERKCFASSQSVRRILLARVDLIRVDDSRSDVFSRRFNEYYDIEFTNS